MPFPRNRLFRQLGLFQLGADSVNDTRQSHEWPLATRNQGTPRNRSDGSVAEDLTASCRTFGQYPDT